MYFNCGSIINCSFIDTNANIYFDDSGSIVNCTFVKCRGYGFGGNSGMIHFNSFGSIVDCNFINYTDNIYDRGGIIYYNKGSGNISNCNFINFIIGSSSYYSETGIIYNNNGSGNISNCNFINCSSNNYNSVIHTYGSGNISNCNFINCSNPSFGSAIRENTGNIYGCSFVNCSSTQGGAIQIGDSGNISDCSFVNCSASWDGGAIDLQGPGNISNCSFLNCSSNQSGGAIDMYYGNVSNCRFIGNKAQWGSALSLGSGEIKNSIFLNNKANSTGITLTQSANIVNILFTGSNNFINAVSSSEGLIFNNVTYWGADGIMNTDTSNISCSDNEAGINISITIDKGGIVKKIMRSTDVNGNIILDLGNEFGNYTISAYHPEDSYYTESKISNLSFSHNFDIIAPNITMYCGNNERFIATLLDKEGNPLVNKNVTIILDGVEYNKVSNDDGIVTLRINNLVNGIYNVIVLCENYRVDSVVNIKPTIIYKDANYKYGDAIFLNATFLDSDGNPLSKKQVSFSVYVGNTHYMLERYTDENGYLIIKDNIFRGASPKNYNVCAYNSVTKDSGVFYINISKSPANISLNVNQNDGIVKLTAKVNPDPHGYMTFVVDNEKYTSDINNGVSELSILDLYPGKYVVNAIFEGNDNVYPSISNNVSFRVLNLNISAPDVTKYYCGSERFVVTNKDKDKANKPIVGAEVKIYLNGQTYTRTTDNNGQASMAINLNSGIYNVTTEYNGMKVYSTVTVKDTVISNDFSKIYRNGTQYYGTFVDSKGNLIRNTDVKININGVFYTKTTDSNGVARMNINLNPGTYILTAINPSSGEQHTTKITVQPSIVENHDVTMYYKNGSRYQVRILGDDGKPVGAGVKVTFNINGVFYERTTDATGHAGLNINLVPGTYTITAEYNGLRASNTIKVLSVLETRDLYMKFRDGSKFEVKVLDGQGNPYSSKIVTFNINGVFYQRMTDDNGIASLSINLLAGDYIITSSFNGLNAANNVRIAPDYLYYTIGSNPLDYDYYMNKYNKFTFDWYYSPQWDAMVRTIYDIYGNQGMEIQDQYVKYGVKYSCWEAATGKEITLNSAGEVIQWSYGRGYTEEYIRYDYNNNIIERGKWVYE